MCYSDCGTLIIGQQVLQQLAQWNYTCYSIMSIMCPLHMILS